MKLLTATAITQGARASDFNFAVEGELVILWITCSRDEREGPDGGCGCGRSWSGLNSHKSTTTAQVRDLDFTFGDLTTAIMAFVESAGWIDLFATRERALEFVHDAAGEMAELAAGYPVGAILERRLDDIAERCVVR